MSDNKASPPQTFVIVKRKKGGHGGHHGGAWKVAYADFVTAMMAFFLVMWIVGQSKAVKTAVAGYFRDPGAFETGRAEGVLPGGRLALELDARPTPLAADPGALLEMLEDTAGRIRDRLSGQGEVSALAEQIEIQITPDGLRIELVDSDASNFFDTGSAKVSAGTAQALTVIARELGSLGRPVVIEGHTDSLRYTRSQEYTNWELSVDRANAARRILEAGGLQPGQVREVRGYADRRPRIAGDASSPRNRRVSIIVEAGQVPDGSPTSGGA